MPLPHIAEMEKIIHSQPILNVLRFVSRGTCGVALDGRVLGLEHKGNFLVISRLPLDRVFPAGVREPVG
jgi:hypothetical protein